MKKADRILGLVALVIVILAWFFGSLRSEAELTPFLRKTLLDAMFFEPLGGDVFAAWKTSRKKELVGYLSVGRAHGYGGELRVAVAVDFQGKIIGTEVIEHKETSYFFSRAKKKGLPGALIGKYYSDPFIPGRDVDSVSGATMSVKALAESVMKASRRIASRNLGFQPIPEPPPRIHFGLAEIVLVLLFLVGFFGRSRVIKDRIFKRTVRWISMLVGIIVLGFVLNRPLTLAHINKILLGYWPQWQLNIYFYTLIGGIFLTILFVDKNPYCEWFCPFGAVQEGLHVIGGQKRHLPQRIHHSLRWFQRFLALGAVVLALLFRNPSISSYEVFGAIFHLVGSNFLFILLGIVLVVSLVIRRPWCLYLCPIRPVIEYVKMTRNTLVP